MRRLEANDCLAVYMFVMLMMIALFARVDVLIPSTQLLLPLQHLKTKLVFLLSKMAVNPIFIIYNDLNDLLSAFTKSMVNMSIKSVPGIESFNPSAGIMTYIISGTGMELTKSPQMVMV